MHGRSTRSAHSTQRAIYLLLTTWGYAASRSLERGKFQMMFAGAAYFRIYNHQSIFVCVVKSKLVRSTPDGSKRPFRLMMCPQVRIHTWSTLVTTTNVSSCCFFHQVCASTRTVQAQQGSLVHTVVHGMMSSVWCRRKRSVETGHPDNDGVGRCATCLVVICSTTLRQVHLF